MEPEKRESGSENEQPSNEESLETDELGNESKCVILSRDEYFDGTYEEIESNTYKSKTMEAYIYRKHNRWAIGPILNANQSWVFRNGHFTAKFIKLNFTNLCH